VSLSPLQTAQGLLVSCAIRDVTERRQLHDLLKHKNTELETAISFADKANQAKSEFLSSMSHELRTPLSAILGFAQLIDSGTPAPTPSQKRSVEHILQAGWYLLELINEILDLALIESGKLSLLAEPVSLVVIMRECESLIESQADKRGVRVTFHPMEQAFFIKADHRRIKQILINLLSNAIKYNKPNGQVDVRCVSLASGRISIGVEDTGKGLSPHEITQLFQPFNRLGQETQAEQGTGIGLVMTKRLVELMGGVISVQSTVGQGSTFWVEMKLADGGPLASAKAADTCEALSPDAAQHGAAAKPARYTLLCVEDNLANLMLIEELIKRRPDLRLLTAREGRRSIEMALAHLPDVILMDINLPDMSGMEVLKQLQANPLTAQIPVLALSANALPMDIKKGLQAGFFKYLTKPIKLNEFMSSLDAALVLADRLPGRRTGPAERFSS
ncbi:MAG: ATP-binding protein, partial [Pseudomonadota bacterium]